MSSEEKIRSEVARICSTEPVSTVFGTLWQLAEREMWSSVLDGIAGLSPSDRNWLKHALTFYNAEEDDGPQDFCAAALVEGKVVEFGHFPKTWVDEIRKVLAQSKES